MTHLLNFWAVKHLSSFLAVKKKGKEKKNRRIEFYILKLRKLHLYLLPLSTHWRIIFRILSFRSISISVSFKYTSNFDTSKTLSFIWNQIFEIFLRDFISGENHRFVRYKKWNFIALRGIIISIPEPICGRGRPRCTLAFLAFFHFHPRARNQCHLKN